MKFVDSCQVRLIAGKGGNGCVAFRREKFVPHGGPSGGDGGKGGDIVFEAAEGMSTLLDFTHAKILRAQPGEPGRGKDQYGHGGSDLVLRVPVGTQVFEVESGRLIADLDSGASRVVVAKGGRGGRGNIHFATSFDRAPRRAEPGEEGEEKDVRLELKVLADVGLLGYPNVGKSTFIRAVSAARPKVADYPFTTLTPHLGVVAVDEDATFVMADIPGLIPGASEGAGLGIRFLKHVERTRALLHLITLDYAEERDPVADYDVLMKELVHFDPELAKRPMIVAMSQADRTEVREAYEAARAKMRKRGVDLRLVSAVTGEGVRELVRDLFRIVRGERLPSIEIEAEATKPKALPKKAEKVDAPAAKAATKATKATTKKATKSATKKAAPKKATKPKTKARATTKATTKKPASRKTAAKPKPKKPSPNAKTKKAPPKKGPRK